MPNAAKGWSLLAVCLLCACEGRVSLLPREQGGDGGTFEQVDPVAALPEISPAQPGLDSGQAVGPTPVPVTPPPPPPPPPEFSRIYYVATSGNDAAAGGSSTPFRTLARGVSVLQPGEALYVRAGTYAERLDLSAAGGARDGAPGKYLTIKAETAGTVTLKGGTGSSKAMLNVQRAYWRVEGLKLDAAGDPAIGALWRGAGAKFGILRGCTVTNGRAGAGVDIAEGASDVLVENNEISKYDLGDGDAHGVILQTTSKNVVVRNNDIHHCSGDAVQCIGPEGGATLPGTPFDNLLVEGNRLHENRENGVDVKTCTRVTVRKNVIYGHKLSSTSGGEGIVIHLSASDVTVEDNQLYENGRGISVGGVRVNGPPARISLRRNRIYRGINANGEDGVGIRVDTATAVKVLNNTIYGMPGAGLMIGMGDTGNSDQVEVRNNIVAETPVFIRLGATRSANVYDRNLFFRSAGAGAFRINGVDVSLAAWRTQTDQDGSSLEASPQLVNPTAADFSLGSGSPAREAGANVGLPFCGSAPDLGALESGC